MQRIHVQHTSYTLYFDTVNAPKYYIYHNFLIKEESLSQTLSNLWQLASQGLKGNKKGNE